MGARYDQFLSNLRDNGCLFSFGHDTSTSTVSASAKNSQNLSSSFEEHEVKAG